jgi:hypothetical protein
LEQWDYTFAKDCFFALVSGDFAGEEDLTPVDQGADWMEATFQRLGRLLGKRCYAEAQLVDLADMEVTQELIDYAVDRTRFVHRGTDKWTVLLTINQIGGLDPNQGVGLGPFLDAAFSRFEAGEAREERFVREKNREFRSEVVSLLVEGEDALTERLYREYAVQRTAKHRAAVAMSDGRLRSSKASGVRVETYVLTPRRTTLLYSTTWTVHRTRGCVGVAG